MSNCLYSASRDGNKRIAIQQVDENKTQQIRERKKNFIVWSLIDCNQRLCVRKFYFTSVSVKYISETDKEDQKVMWLSSAMNSD